MQQRYIVTYINFLLIASGLIKLSSGWPFSTVGTNNNVNQDFSFTLGNPQKAIRCVILAGTIFSSAFALDLNECINREQTGEKVYHPIISISNAISVDDLNLKPATNVRPQIQLTPDMNEQIKVCA